jgi:EmrB/QacA subfamily drug resistance transporter
MQRNNANTPDLVAPGQNRSHAEKMRVITGVIVCILLAALDQTVVLPAIPQMAASLHGFGHLSWVVSAYLLSTTATTPIYGKLSDQLGRRAVLVPAIGLFLLASIFCALADSVPMLIIGRALQGVGGGALMSVSQAAVADVVTPRERGKYQGWFAGIWAFASIAGPILGGFVVQHLSWRWIFWANLPVGAAAMILCIRGLSGIAPAGRRGRIDFAGAGLLLLGVTAILAALSTGGVDFPWLSGPVAGLFAIGALITAILARQQRRAAEPLFPGVLMGKAGFRAIIAISFLNAAAMFAGIFLLPLLLQMVFRASPAASGLEIMPFLATTTIGAFTAGQIAQRTGRPRAIMVFGLGLAAMGMFVLALAPLNGSLIIPVGISAVSGLGIGCVMPTSLVSAQSQSGLRDVGAATGILLLLRALGGAFGATLGGAVLAIAPHDLLHGFRLGFFAAAGMLAAAAIIALQMENFLLRNTLDTAQPADAD